VEILEDHVLPGAATSYQKGGALNFDVDALRVLDELDLIDLWTVGNSDLLFETFRESLSRMPEALPDVSKLPEPLRIVVSSNALGITTKRYDAFYGVGGAPTVWIYHELVRPIYTKFLLRALDS
jgi:hypothetical protein